MIYPEKVKKDFPFFAHNKKLVYLDNAATTQKPRAVMDAVRDFWVETNANIHRGIYRVSEEATRQYESARTKVSRFIDAPDPRQIIFTKGATESINLVARGLAARLKPGDEILLTIMEHHANIVPWQMLARERKLSVRFVNVTARGTIDEKDLRVKITPRTKLFAVTHVSNVLGTINPVKKLVRRMHARGIPVLVDGAQAIGHMPISVRDLGCDFYAFSGHKMLAPSGVGVLYIGNKYCDTLPPLLGGGEMIRSVTTKGFTTQDAPAKFEAGTPPMEAAVGLGAAVTYLKKLGMRTVRAHEMLLIVYTLKKLSMLPLVTVFGPHNAKERSGVISFSVQGIHPHDLAELLDHNNIAVRAGHHCAMPLHRYLRIPATARISFSVYTTTRDIDRFLRTLQKIIHTTRHEH
ncbi:MAG: cysteine desulfurase [Patescibacteria group bacterium]